ncbi:DNA cytosine methyltransferase [Pseudactinotalea sp. Z1748]|uniref:DNA cytosine methyltransferase n=1 Tax=Pseudactinotalea sp. Z1748 TaxID=3413027 RepID=UPI003C7AF690
MWFSELNESVAAVFSRHWPGIPNLGDITTINWQDVEPVDILIGGFPARTFRPSASEVSLTLPVQVARGTPTPDLCRRSVSAHLRSRTVRWCRCRARSEADYR